MANTEKRKCCQCGTSLPKTDYYKSNSDFFIDKLLPICKQCFNQDVKLFVENSNYKSRKKAMQRMCMAFDVYYDDDLFEKCDDNEDVYIVIGNYMKRLNMAQYKNKTFETTIQSNGLDLGYVGSDYEENQNIKVKRSDIEKWGYGFEPTDYEILNSHYKYLKIANPNCDSNQEIFIIDLCYTNMQKMRALRESRVDDYNKLTESYRKSFNQAGLKTSQDGMKTSDDCWSTWVGVVSQYTPEEYYMNKKRYCDFDGLGEYYQRLAVRPLKNIVLGTNERDSEFYIHEDDSDE